MPISGPPQDETAVRRSIGLMREQYRPAAPGAAAATITKLASYFGVLLRQSARQRDRAGGAQRRRRQGIERRAQFGHGDDRGGDICGEASAG